MLVTLTPKTRGAGVPGLAAALLDCHERIRRFAGMAVHLGTLPDAPEAEIRDAAARTRRYFTDALPLHVEDEEQSVLPRLLGRSPELDAALGTMRREHGEHAPLLARLVELLAASAENGRISDELAPLATALREAFDAHLAAEESIVLPAIDRELDAETQQLILAELRRRRMPGGSRPESA